MRVLLAEDDSLIGESVRKGLQEEAFAVDWVRDGEAAVAAFSAQNYDLLLLDIGLPGQDGMQVLAQLRRRHLGLPVIFITARDGLDDRIRGLDLGADDFLVKPFAMSELLARIRAVLRRHSGSGDSALSNGDMVLDPRTHQVVRGDVEVMLTAREFSLLRLLLQSPGTLYSRTELEDRIYGWNEEIESNAIEFIIHSLRKKLGADAIKNVRGAGWMVMKAL